MFGVLNVISMTLLFISISHLFHVELSLVMSAHESHLFCTMTRNNLSNNQVPELEVRATSKNMNYISVVLPIANFLHVILSTSNL